MLEVLLTVVLLEMEELLKNKKIVYIVHSVPTPEPPPTKDPFGGNDDVRQKFEHICNCSSVIICVSEAEKGKLINLYPNYANKVKVVYNGITINKKPTINMNYKKSRRIFGYIGRMDYRKGILECIKAFKNIDGELRLACPNNDRVYLNRILDYIEGAGLTNKVSFYGWCIGKRKENFLNSLDALIIPSLYEPFGYVALEAMLYGLPVISSNNGGLDEILKDYKYKFNPYQKGAMEDQIKIFIEDSNEEVKRQQEILIDALGRFSAENMVNQYNQIFDELL